MASTFFQIRLLDVWRALGGPEPRRGRGPAWWRGSRDLNVSVDVERSVFYDHARNCGGGVLALVETVLNCDCATALRWLEGQGFIELRNFTHEQRREHVRRRVQARSAALEIAYWRRAFIEELNMRKLVAAADDSALSGAASVCNLLENGSPQDLIREFMRARGADHRAVERCIAVGKERESEDSRMTAELVLFLAGIAQLEARSNAE